MLTYPHPRQQLCTYNFSGRPSATMGTNVVSGGTAHTLSSSFTELFSATAHDAFGVEIIIHNTAAGNTDTPAFLNLYKGANGSEVLFMQSLSAGWAPIMTNGQCARHYWFPVYIPSGTRITGKSSALQTSKNIYVIMILHGGGGAANWYGRGVETLGATTSTSSGTNVTPGTTSEGSFASIGTSGYEYGFIMPMLHANTDSTANNDVLDVDIGTGSNPIPGLEQFAMGRETGDESCGNASLGRYCSIPSGTALQMRAQSSNSAEIGEFLIHGVY